MTDKPIVVVTGASMGIGRAAAVTMARAGWHVIAVARSEKKLEALDDEIKALTGENITIVPLDIKDGAAIDRLGFALFERYKKLDGLIHCAAMLDELMPVAHFTPRTVNNMVETNVTATFRIIASLGPLLEQSPFGRAVFLSSTVAAEPRAFWGMYGATKAAMSVMAQAWAQENTLNNIVVTVLNPGGVATSMRKAAFPGEDQNTLPQPEDLGTMFLELMSPERPKSLNGAVVNFRDTEHFKAWQEKQKTEV